MAFARMPTLCVAFFALWTAMPRGLSRVTSAFENYHHEAGLWENFREGVFLGVDPHR